MAKAIDTRRPIEVLTWSPQYAKDFERLNIEWLQRYFYVEPVDKEVLGDPGLHIISHGGEILFARVGDEIIGTVALKNHGESRFELTKMAVTQGWQGLGIGRRLAAKALDSYKDRSGTYLYLESHSSLSVALTLYESIGFKHVPRPGGKSIYARADVYMVYQP
jgi:ribosomal protein S18 acetylase RimI-like enzyme